METLLDGIFHPISSDIETALKRDLSLVEKWNKLTPIQRNEWICWVTIVKKAETREAHVQRLLSDLQQGKKSPCCWPGCPHRRPEAQKWFKKSAKESDNCSV
jgi:hypothetical protein